MNEILILFFVAIAGLFLGGIFYGGLWFTVSRGLHSQSPAGLFLLSFLFRTGITVAGFYLICGDQWQRFISCIAGFLIARLLVAKITEHLSNNENSTVKEIEA